MSNKPTIQFESTPRDDGLYDVEISIIGTQKEIDDWTDYIEEKSRALGVTPTYVVKAQVQ